MKKQLSAGILLILLLTQLVVGCDNLKSESVIEESQPIHIYSTDDIISQRMEYVLEKHEDWRSEVEFVILPEEGYREAIDELLSNPSAEKCPDIILAEYEDIGYLTASDAIDDLAGLELTDSELDQMYPYTKEVVTDMSGNLKGITWKIDPGAFVYRKSLAKEFLGYDDEENVQAFVRDFDTMIDTARTIDRKSEGNVKILASVNDIDKTFYGQPDEDTMVKYHRQLEEYGFTLGLDVDSDQFIRTSNKGKVFGYFCNIDILNALEKVSGSNSKGDWAVCQGPQRYISGGQWIFVSKNCSQKELAQSIIRTLCTDENILKKINENDCEFVNNIHTMSNAYNTGKGKIDLLGGGDYIAVFDKTAKKMHLNTQALEVVNDEATTKDQEEQ